MWSRRNKPHSTWPCLWTSCGPIASQCCHRNLRLVFRLALGVPAFPGGEFWLFAGLLAVAWFMNFLIVCLCYFAEPQNIPVIVSPSVVYCSKLDLSFTINQSIDRISMMETRSTVSNSGTLETHVSSALHLAHCRVIRVSLISHEY